MGMSLDTLQSRRCVLLSLRILPTVTIVGQWDDSRKGAKAQRGDRLLIFHLVFHHASSFGLGCFPLLRLAFFANI